MRRSSERELWVEDPDGVPLALLENLHASEYTWAVYTLVPVFSSQRPREVGYTNSGAELRVRLYLTGKATVSYGLCIEYGVFERDEQLLLPTYAATGERAGSDQCLAFYHTTLGVCVARCKAGNSWSLLASPVPASLTVAEGVDLGLVAALFHTMTAAQPTTTTTQSSTPTHERMVDLRTT